MFNHHSKEQNVGWERDVKRLLIIYKTLKDIREGEELCKNVMQNLHNHSTNGKVGISYGGRLWFQDTDAQQDSSESDDGSGLLSSIQIN
jgi:SET domain-containing protein